MKNTTQTNNGKKGGLLKGKPHYDKDGKPLGGIKAVVTDSGQQVELEGGEVIINKEASKKHWKELSRINQSAGNGVPILPPDDTDSDVDTEDFEKGGKIDFNPNKIPSKKIYNYAKKIKEKYPKVWDMGGNIFGNEAYKNLERALNRGYWLDSEDWMYKKWQSFNARHSGDIRIAGIIANLKWLNVVDKGWQYMKDLIEAEIEKKYGDNKMAEGGNLIKRADGSYSRHGLWDSIRENAGSGKKPTKEMLRQEAKIKSEMAKGGSVISQFKVTSGRGGGKETWIVSHPKIQDKGVYFKSDYSENEAKKTFYENVFKNYEKGLYAKGGELAKGIKVEKEHSKTANKLYNRKITPQQSFEEIAKDHLKDDKHYYSKLAVFENKMADGGNIDVSNFGFKTPTGRPSKLTYLQQILVRTKAFKDWFGDWELVAKEVMQKKLLDNNATDKVLFNLYKDCSKIIDGETLEPRLVFHGTRNDDEFFKFKTNIGNYGRPYSYFAYNREYSQNFTNKDKDEQNWSGMYDVFLNVRNPLVMLGKIFEDKRYDFKDWMLFLTAVTFRDKFQREIDVKQDEQYIKDIIDDIGSYIFKIGVDVGNAIDFWKFMAYDVYGDFKMFLQKYGYDGVIYTEQAFVGYDVNNPAQYTKAVTIFDSNQVKLGDGRNVDFNNSSDDIRFKDGGILSEKHRHIKYPYHKSLVKSIFGDGGVIEEEDFDEAVIINKTKGNREFVENLIKKMQ